MGDKMLKLLQKTQDKTRTGKPLEDETFDFAAILNGNTEAWEAVKEDSGVSKSVKMPIPRKIELRGSSQGPHILFLLTTYNIF